MEGAKGGKENWCSQHACLELNPDRKESGKGNRRFKRKGSGTETERRRLHFAMQILPAEEVESWCCFHTEREVWWNHLPWSLPDLAGAAKPRASSGGLSYHLGIVLPSSYLKSKIRSKRRKTTAKIPWFFVMTFFTCLKLSLIVTINLLALPN